MKTAIDMTKDEELEMQCYVNGAFFNPRKYAALVRADEREACAKVCEDEICNCCWDEEAGAVAEHLAATIRARGNT